MRHRDLHRAVLLAALAAPLAAASCQGTYYRTMEAFGKHKRDLLVERVGAARDSQTEAKQQFKSALDRFSELVQFEGGDLKAKYDQLSKELARSEDKADTVRKRIAAVDTVAQDLFKEWRAELQQYSSDDLRQMSELQLRATQRRYGLLLDAMKKAEAKMGPVLVAFRDQVLFLKHNLNAQAVASLEGTVVTLESDVGKLIADMEASIQEANGFIEAMQKP